MSQFTLFKDFDCEAIVIGASAGGIAAFKKIFAPLDVKFQLPILCVMHLHPEMGQQWLSHIQKFTAIELREAKSNQMVQKGLAYFPLSGYHMRVNENRTVRLTLEERVSYARPSIDVLFESASEVYGNKLLAILMTGANSDGTKGLIAVSQAGGRVVVQDPEEAASGVMPKFAMEKVQVDAVLKLHRISKLMSFLASKS